METWMIALIVVALVAVATMVWVFMSRQQSDQLRDRFGPEYENVTSTEGHRAGERALRERQERVEHLQIQGLSNEDLQRFGRDWRNLQTHFVDDPEKCVVEADDLVQKVMSARGYPLTGFDRQSEDISVDHPEVVSNYRAAHDIAKSSRRHEATTEDLRQAMIHYRALFSNLLGNGRQAARAS